MPPRRTAQAQQPGPPPPARLSAEKHQEVREAFNLFDTDGTGRIPLGDVEIALRALGVTLTPTQLRVVHKALTDTETTTSTRAGAAGSPSPQKVGPPLSLSTSSSSASSLATATAAGTTALSFMGPESDTWQGRSASTGSVMVTFDTFVVQAARLLGDKDYEADMRKAFKLFDSEDKGSISFKNLERVARELGEGYTVEDLQAMIEEADRDRDGFVNEEEFMHVMRKALLY